MTNKQLAVMLRSAASAVSHGRRSTAQKKVFAVYEALIAPNVVLEIGDPPDPDECDCGPLEPGTEHDTACAGRRTEPAAIRKLFDKA